MHQANVLYQASLTLTFSTSCTGLTCESLNFSHSFVAGFCANAVSGGDSLLLLAICVCLNDQQKDYLQ